MKIQLLLEQHKDMVSNFEDCQRVFITQLNQISQASCTLVHMGNVHDFVKNDIELMAAVVSKLRYGGNLVIEGTDVLEVAYDIASGALDVNKIQHMLFDGRFHCRTHEDILKLLRSQGLKILSNRLNQYKYSIRAERPHV